MGTLNADDIKATIHELVDKGFYLDEFLDALEATRPRMNEVVPAFLAALTHKGIALPEKEQAVCHLIEIHLKSIVSGGENALEELGKLIADVYWDYDFQTPTKKYIGDSHGMEQLIGLYWSADDLRESPASVSFNGKYGQEAWSELKREIIVHAKRWLAARESAR